ncbi:MAG: carboxypeptidase regulatory-like domain-containing protein [Candidatus Aminicenantales bacterium]
MRKALALFSLVLLLGVFVYGQEAGSIRGKVVDKEGNLLPGVNVTLTGSKTAPLTTVTSAEGNFRFLHLAGASDYVLKCVLQGFKPYNRTQLAISYGKDIMLDITMEQAALEEMVTVVGHTPVIDTKKTQVGINITEDMIMRLPTARDPWVLMQLAPGMLIDRENVGGSDSGQQSSYFGHGSNSGDSTWSVDGGNITDNAALGASPGYFSVAGYEEIQINYGNNDIKSQTGGVQLNFITKRGGNAFSGTFYLDAEKNAWQSKNIPQDLLDLGYKGAGINKVYLYGANFGGPIFKEKLWFYGSYGIQDLGTNTLAGTTDNSWLESGYFRLDGQVTKSTRLNALYEYDNKLKWGRTNWGPTLQGPETVWNQTGPTPIYKGEVEQMFGNLVLNLKAIYTHNVFYLVPLNGHFTPGEKVGPYEDQVRWPSFYASGNAPGDYGTIRPQTNINFIGNYFAEKVLGADHEIKFGVDYTHSTVSSYSILNGNAVIAHYEPLEDGTPWTEAWINRDWRINESFTRTSIFAQDTLSFGRKLAINIGLRYDMEKSLVANENIPTAPLMSNYLVGMDITSLDPGIRSKVLSPRLSVIYDITGDGKNVLKLNLARYGSQTGYGLGDFLNPAPWAEIDLRWVDANGDGIIQQNELHGTDWETGLPTVDRNDPNGWSWFTGFNPANPTAGSANKYDPRYKTPLLDEISFSYEREIIPDFAARLELFYKNTHRESWDRAILEDGSLETQENFVLEGTDPTTGSNYYGRVSPKVGWYRSNYVDGTLQPDGTTNGTTLLKAHEVYKAVELVIKKRLSHNWMLDGSFTFSDWKYYHGNDKSIWPYDLTNYDYYEGGVIAPQSGGSGITDVYVNSRWMFKLAGLYQFPYGIAASFAFNAREGYVYPPYVWEYESNIGWVEMNATKAGEVGKFGDTRLPNFYELNLHLEKMFTISNSLHVTAAIDCFNVFNSATALSVQAELDATDTNGNSTYGQTLRILNPRIFRAGVRIEF